VPLLLNRKIPMNLERIAIVRQAMVEAKERQTLSMVMFQTHPLDDDSRSYPLASTMEDFHACGNTACLAGHIALLPEFLNAEDPEGSYRVSAAGSPTFHYHRARVSTNPGTAIGRWLDVPARLIDLLIYDYTLAPKSMAASGKTVHGIYGKPFSTVTPDDVIAVLDELVRTTETQFVCRHIDKWRASEGEAFKRSIFYTEASDALDDLENLYQ